MAETIRSGRLSTVSVDGANWMSCINSFWKITLPGVVARLRPTSNIEESDWAGFSARPPPLSMSSASMRMPRTRVVAFDVNVSRRQLGIGEDEIRRRQCVGDLPHIKLGFLPGVRIEIGGIADEIVGPARGEEIGPV